MKFHVEGLRTRTIVTTIVERVEGEISILKKDVQRVTGCESTVDGDSTYWYGEVEDALEAGAPHKADSDSIAERISETSVVSYDWESIESVDW